MVGRNILKFQRLCGALQVQDSLQCTRRIVYFALFFSTVLCKINSVAKPFSLYAKFCNYTQSMSSPGIKIPYCFVMFDKHGLCYISREFSASILFLDKL